MPTLVDTAYMAGILDGEGYVGITQVGTKENPQTVSRVRIAMTDKNVIEWVHANWPSSGIKIDFRSRKSLAHYKDQHWVQWTGQRAADFLQELLPFLKVKRDQALLVIELANRKSLRKPYSKKDSSEVEADLAAFIKIKELNQRGVCHPNL